MSKIKEFLFVPSKLEAYCRLDVLVHQEACFHLLQKMFLRNPSLGNKFIKTVTLSKVQKEILKAVDQILVFFKKYYYFPCFYGVRGNG